MGYQTDFAIRMKAQPDGPGPYDLEDVSRELSEMLRYAVGIYRPTDEPSVNKRLAALGSQPFLYVTEAKWHEHEDDLDDLSRRFAGAVFHVLGIGEDTIFGDVWTQTFKDGKHSEKQYEMPRMLLGW